MTPATWDEAIEVPAWPRGGIRDDVVAVAIGQGHTVGSYASQADGAESTPEGRAVINRMSASTGRPVIVVSFYERRIQRVVGSGIE